MRAPSAIVDPAPPPGPAPCLPSTAEETLQAGPAADDPLPGKVVPELLDLVCELLQQHETRLCINMLEALKHTEAAHLMNGLLGFVAEQESAPNEGLRTLTQRVQGLGGCEVNPESPKRKRVNSVLDTGRFGHQTSLGIGFGSSQASGSEVKKFHGRRLSSVAAAEAASVRDAQISIHDNKGDSQLAVSRGSNISGNFHMAKNSSEASSHLISGTPRATTASEASASSYVVAPYLDLSPRESPPRGRVTIGESQSASAVSKRSSERTADLAEDDPEDGDDEEDDNDDNDDDEWFDSADEGQRSGGSGKAGSRTVSFFDSYGCIVHPSSSGRLTWDCIGLAFVLGEGVCVPLSLGFDIDLPEWWQWGATGFFATDMFTQFFTGFFRDGTLIMQRSIIAKHYLATFFVIDLIATVPWEVMLGGLGGDSAASLSLARVARVGKTLRLFRLLRIFRIVRMKELLNHLESLLSAYKVGLVLNLLKAPTLFLVLCHWAACLWGFLGQPEDKRAPYSMVRELCEPGGPCEPGLEGSPWMRRYGLDNYQAATRYLIALQSSAGLLTGGGVALEAGFWSERIYVLGMMIGSFFLCAIVLSRIVVVVDEMSKSQSELKKQLRDAKTFMIARKIPRLLQSKVTQHIEFQAKTQMDNPASLKSVMQQLSPWLRLEITEHMNRGVILHHPFFRDLPNKLVKHICSAAQIVICAPGDLVVQQGHRATNMCFLVQGRLKVRPPQVNKKSKLVNGQREPRAMPCFLDPPCWIGDMCLFQDDVLRTNTVVSIGHAELLVITKEALLALIEDFPGARRHYEAYKRRLAGDTSRSTFVKVRCQYCGRGGHHGADCPNIGKVPMKTAQQKFQHSVTTMSMAFKPLRIFGLSNAPETLRSARDTDYDVSEEQPQSSLDSLQPVVCEPTEAEAAKGVSRVVSFPPEAVAGGKPRTQELLRQPANDGGDWKPAASLPAHLANNTTTQESSAPAMRGAENVTRSDAVNAWVSQSVPVLVPGQTGKSSDEDDQENLLR